VFATVPKRRVIPPRPVVGPKKEFRVRGPY
jgi:hypothetical protein